MQVGDLVRYKYREQDVGIIIDTGHGVDGRAPKHKVMWLGFHNSFDWMLPTGLEVISESR
jgi:hypothetical protein